MQDLDLDEDNIKSDLKEIGGRMWTAFIWHIRIIIRNIVIALVNCIVNLCVPYNIGNFLTSWETISYWRKTVHYEVLWLTHLLEFSNRYHEESEFYIYVFAPCHDSAWQAQKERSIIIVWRKSCRCAWGWRYSSTHYWLDGRDGWDWSLSQLHFRRKS
jgi:hypothetical protein